MPRPKGLPKTGGRKKGSNNKIKAEAIEAIKVAESQPVVVAPYPIVKPLDYMLMVLSDPGTPEPRKDDMAKAAAPYVHPRLQAIQQMNLPPPSDGKVIIDLDLARRIAFTLQDARRQKLLMVKKEPA